MKNKLISLAIFGIFLISMTGSITNAQIFSLLNDDGDEELDQYQEKVEVGYASVGGCDPDRFEYAQSFKPTKNILTRIELNADFSGAVGSYPEEMIFTIRKELDGNNLAAPVVMDHKWRWLEYDFYDIQVTPEETYYIVWGDIGGNGFFASSDSYNYLRGNGQTYSASYGWGGAGRDFCFRTYGKNGTDGNNPPANPIQISTTQQGMIGVEQFFEYRATDIDHDQVKFKIDWGDGSPITETELHNSGENIRVSHVWGEKGVYWCTITTVDEHGAESPEDYCPEPVYIREEENSKPMQPLLSGDKEGAFNEDFEFNAITWDCDMDEIYYLFVFGDETDSGWVGPYQSGEVCTVTKSWNGFFFTDYYDIRVIAKDSNDAKSKYSEIMTVKVYQGRAKSMQSVFPRLSNLLERLF